MPLAAYRLTASLAKEAKASGLAGAQDGSSVQPAFRAHPGV